MIQSHFVFDVSGPTSDINMATPAEDVEAKKASLTSKLQAREDERHNIIKKRTEEKLLNSSEKENIDFFLEGIQKEKRLIEEFLSTCESLDKGTLPNKFEEITVSLGELQKYVTESAIFLPNAVLRRAQIEINNLKNDLLNKKEAVLPKKKFTFKSKKKFSDKIRNDPTPKIEESKTEELEISLTECHFADRENETLIKQAEETNKEDALLTKLTDCSVKLYGAPSAVHINFLKNCKVFSGPVSSAIFINDCSNCTFVLGCQQLRIHQSHKCHFYIHVTSRAIIEECTEVAFAPYNWDYPEIDDHYELSGLNRERNNWNLIDDFNWLSTDVHSPNWTLIDETERVLTWPS